MAEDPIDNDAELSALLSAPPSQTRRPTVPAMEERLYTPVRVLDHGFVRAIDYMGDDSAIAPSHRGDHGRGRAIVALRAPGGARRRRSLRAVPRPTSARGR